MDNASVVGSIEIAADEQTVYGLIVDLTAWRCFTAECRKCRWKHGDGAAVGSTFTGWNRRGPLLWRTTATVVCADPPRSFAFKVTAFGRPISNWRYDVVPTERGCRVTESSRDMRATAMRLLTMVTTGVTDRTSRNRRNIEVTLIRLKANAERVARQSGRGRNPLSG